jgi:hypothetical protein
MSIVRPALCTLFLVACSEAEVPTGEAAKGGLSGDESRATVSADAHVTNVYAREEKDGTWTFHVSVQHPDKSFSDFADGWDLVTSSGAVLKRDPAQRFTKTLRQPHIEEQPFTRTVKGLRIPEGVEVLTVRAHDSLGGFGGREVLVKLSRRFGQNFSVKRAL